MCLFSSNYSEDTHETFKKPPHYTMNTAGTNSNVLEFPAFEEKMRKDERFDKVCFGRFLLQLRFSASARGDDALFHLLLLLLL